MSTLGRTSAGGLSLGSRALGIWGGCSAAMWLIIACMAAAGLRSAGAWKRQRPNKQARATAMLSGELYLDRQSTLISSTSGLRSSPVHVDDNDLLMP